MTVLVEELEADVGIKKPFFEYCFCGVSHEVLKMALFDSCDPLGL